ncbi:hypothetical protein PENTCL1PPCAC_2371, partial [Pristionchus entomophagus]
EEKGYDYGAAIIHWAAGGVMMISLSLILLVVGNMIYTKTAMNLPSSSTMHNILKPESLSLPLSHNRWFNPDLPSSSSIPSNSITQSMHLLSLRSRARMTRTNSLFFRMGIIRRIIACFSGDSSEDEDVPSSSDRQESRFDRHDDAPIHKIVEFTYELVPDMDKILAASYYWGRMDRFHAEELLKDQPEGTFLLRDSAQPEFIFSVSFRRYKRTLHARIEQANGSFGFDILDQSAFRAPTITKLIQNYADPTRCLFFEPQLSNALHRQTVFSLQELSRSVVMSGIRYKEITSLPIPSQLHHYLSEYHFSVPIRTIRPHPSPNPQRL